MLGWNGWTLEQIFNNKKAITLLSINLFFDVAIGFPLRKIAQRIFDAVAKFQGSKQKFCLV